MKKYLIIMSLVCSFVICNLSFAYAARPLVTDDHGTVDPGKYELEKGYTSTLNPVDPDDDGAVENTTYSGGISFKGGMLPGLDLGVELPFNLSSPLGMNDSIFHIKYRIVELAEDEGVTIRGDVKAANRYEWEGYGTGDTDIGLILIYSKKIGKFNTHYNFGYTCACIMKGEMVDDKDDITLTSAAVEYPMFGELGDVVAELALANAPYSNEGFVQVGARYIVGIARLDAGYSFGLNKYSIKNSATVGLTFEF